MYVNRLTRKLFDKVFGAYKVVAIVGARQAGKTTFLLEQVREPGMQYVLFDDPDAKKMFEEDVKKFENQYIKGHEVTILDEVQNCTGAGQKIKYLADTGHKLLLTSSSEVLLGKEILSYLVGRVSIIRMWPFSLEEFLDAKKQKELTRQILERSVWEHAVYGGYPKAVLSGDVELKKIILKDIYDTLVFKDLAKTFSISDSRALEDLAKYLANNVGGTLSYETASNSLNLSFQTLKKYVDAMEKSYLIVRVPPFYTNRNKEITKQPKVFFVDTGMRNSIQKSFPSELDGKIFENYALTELLKQGFTPKYWRTKTGAEVDFVIEKGNEIIPIEVKLSATPGKIGKSLRAFIKAHNPKKAMIITPSEQTAKGKIEGCEIIITNIKDFAQAL